MKNLLLFISLSFFLNSCSTEDQIDQTVVPETTIAESFKASVMPQNRANYIDAVGENYTVALNEFNQHNDFPNSIKEMGNQIRFLSKQFKPKRQTTKRIIPFTDDMVQAIMNDPDNCMIAIVEDSSLSLGVKAGLIEFLQSLIGQREGDFISTYEFIVAYENTVIADSSIDVDEKDTLLTVTSISRYSLYSEAERKDRDWETSVASRKAKPFFSNNETVIISIIVLLTEII